MNQEIHALWSEAVRSAFSWLVRLRRTEDYSGRMHVSVDDNQEAVDKARCILHAIRTTSPEPLPPIEDAL